MTSVVLLPWQLSWLQFLSVKNQISPFASSLSNKTEGPTLLIRLLGVPVDDPCLSQKL